VEKEIGCGLLGAGLGVAGTLIVQEVVRPRPAHPELINAVSGAVYPGKRGEVAPINCQVRWLWSSPLYESTRQFGKDRLLEKDESFALVCPSLSFLADPARGIWWTSENMMTVVASVRVRGGEAIYEFACGGWPADITVAGAKYELQPWQHITVKVALK